MVKRFKPETKNFKVTNIYMDVKTISPEEEILKIPK